MYNKDEIVLGLRNDGCVGPPGQLTITARFFDGKESHVTLPMGEPIPGAMRLFGLPMSGDTKYSVGKPVKLSMRMRMKGKTRPVQWAVEDWRRDDPFDLNIHRA